MNNRLMLVIFAHVLLFLFLTSCACSQDAQQKLEMKYKLHNNVINEANSTGQRTIEPLAIANTTSLSIMGKSFEDLNNNSIRDDNEQGLLGWKINLMRNGTKLFNTTTDESGNYVFTNLKPGKYEVVEEQEAGWNQTRPGTEAYQITLTDRNANNLDFGNSKASTNVSPDQLYMHPIMHPSPEEIRKWEALSKSAPSATVNPQIGASMVRGPGEYFSLLDYLQYDPHDRNQGDCGNCWVWAATGVVEIDQAVHKNIKDRLSIQYFDSKYNDGTGSGSICPGDDCCCWACCGGNPDYFADFYNIDKVLVPWSNSNAQWQDGGRECSNGGTSVPAQDISVHPHNGIISIQAEQFPAQGANAIDNIKNILLQNKAIYFAFALPTKDSWTEFNNYWNSEKESKILKLDFANGIEYNFSPNEGGSHAVLCVGYNDSDPNNRYWIMLNSWGDSINRPHGLFYVDMDMDYSCSYPNYGSAFQWRPLKLSYPFSEYETDFEKYDVGKLPPEFNVYYNGKGSEYQIVTSDQHYSDLKSLQVWGRPNWCSNVHYYFVKPQKGIIGYEVRVRANPKEEGFVQFVNPEGGPWTWGWCGVGFDQDGYITAPGGFKRICFDDKWYKVKAEMDVETGACWIWLDDELITDGITPVADGKVNPEAYKGIRGVLFGDCSWYENPSTPTYFDDFKFYTLDTLPPDVEWQKCLGGSGLEHAIGGAKQTKDGGYIIAGFTHGSYDGDVSGNNGGTDIWVVKLDVSGNIQWQKCLGGSNTEYAYSIEQTKDEGYIVAGFAGSNDGDVIGNHGGLDFWVAKLDVSGNIQWQKCLGGTQMDIAYSVKQTADEGYIVTGITESNDVSGYHGSDDFLVVKLDGSGNIQWQKCLGGSGPDQATSIDLTDDGGYIVAGYTNSNDNDVSGGHGGGDFWVIKLDGSGNIQWQNCLGGTAGEGAYSIKQVDGGGYIVAGFTDSDDDDVSGDHGGTDFWVIKLDGTGNLLWQRCLGGTGQEIAYDVKQTNEGGYVVTGYTYSNDGDVIGNHGADDFWVVKLDNSGNIEWQKCLGGTSENGGLHGTGEERAYSIQQTIDGGYVVAGLTNSYNGDVIGKHSSDDAWAVKLKGPSTNNPPNAPSIPSGPNSGLAGTSNIYSTSAIDPDEDQVKYTFDWGDGTTSDTDFVASGTSGSASHSWSNAGTYQIKANAMDSKGASSSWSNALSVTITAANQPPNKPSMPSGAASGYTGAIYSYATSAADPNGDQVKYTFDWGDGTNIDTGFVTSGTSSSASHSWSSAGTYQVKANAMDSNSATSEWSNLLAVTIQSNKLPNVPGKPSGSSTGVAGSTFSYSTSAKDPDGDQVKYVFDWGDGTTSETAYIRSSAKASASHVWDNAGTYLVKAKAVDSKGAPSSAWSSSLSVKVNPNRPPNAPGKPSGSTKGYAWASYSYSTSAKDPDGDLVKYTLDWGDGTTSDTILVKSGAKASASHIWGSAGTYLVKAAAMDSKGESSGPSTALTVTILANNPPCMPNAPSGPISGKIKKTYSYTASSVDSDGDKVKFTFDWGDGTTSTTSLFKSGTSASSSHRWSKAGTYQVKSRAIDSKGSSSAWSSQLEVIVS
jgi:hypothetical protein